MLIAFVCVCVWYLTGGFLSPQAALRQKELEKSVQWAQENDKTLRQIQDSLANTDRHLTAYLADHIDAQQIPQEAQVAVSVCRCVCVLESLPGPVQHFNTLMIPQLKVTESFMY